MVALTSRQQPEIDNKNTHCKSLSQLSHIAGVLISQDDQAKRRMKSNGKAAGGSEFKSLLQACVDSLSDYRDTCKKLQKLGILKKGKSNNNDNNSAASLPFPDIKSNGLRPEDLELLESAYVYYKIVHILVSTRIPNLQEFQNIKAAKNSGGDVSKTERELMEIYNTLLNTMLEDEYIGSIKNFIKTHSNNSSGNDGDDDGDSKPVADNNTLTEDTATATEFTKCLESGSQITATQLQKLLSDTKSGGDTLLIDIRSRAEFEQCHIEAPNVICIEPISFKEEYTDRDVEKKSMIISPSEEIGLFHNRASYRYIVLYTSCKRSDSSYNAKRQSTLMNILLTRSFDVPLDSSETKVFTLRDGFEAWTDIGGATCVTGGDRSVDPNDTDDSIYLNGNTSRLSLQSFPKMVPTLDISRDRSFQDMLSLTSPDLLNSSLLLREQQQQQHGQHQMQHQLQSQPQPQSQLYQNAQFQRSQGSTPQSNLKRSSSFRRTLSKFKEFASGVSTNGSSVNTLTPGPTPVTVPPLMIRSKSSTYELSSGSSYSLPLANNPQVPISSHAIRYPEAPKISTPASPDQERYLTFEVSRSTRNPLNGNHNDHNDSNGGIIGSAAASMNRNITPINTRALSPSTAKIKSPMYRPVYYEDGFGRSPPLSRSNEYFSIMNNQYGSNASRNAPYNLSSQAVSRSVPQLPQLPSKPVSFLGASNTAYPSAQPKSFESVPGYSGRQSNYDLDFLVGLENMGNSCYVNCTVQCLLGTHELTKIFLNNSYENHINLNSRLGSKGVLAKNFARLVQTMYSNAMAVRENGLNVKRKPTPVKPMQFKIACGSINSLFKSSQQQDSQEFVQFLLDGLHEDLNQCGGNPPLKELSKQAEELREGLSFRIASAIEWERYLTVDFSVIVDLFQGQYASRLQCKACGHTSTTYQPFSVLSVPIPRNMRIVTLTDCFNEFTKVEDLDTDEQWSCPKCKKRQPSTKKLTITRLPKNLIIHLKRFDNMLRKNNSFINYPFHLDLTKYWPNDFDGRLPPGITEELPTRGQVPPFKYQLYGVACHSGSLYGGHYTAYVYKGSSNGWNYFDDTNYRPIKTSNEPITSSAYVLFYHRTYGTTN